VLNASVHCEQKGLQGLSETVLANNRVSQADILAVIWHTSGAESGLI